MKALRLFLISSYLLVLQSAIGQNVFIPDENFKNRLIELGIDTNNDGEINYAEAEAKTGELNLSTQQIADATGIEAFTNITKLNANLNQLISLDLSDNKSLLEIYCWGNQLTELIFYPITNLKIVDCSDNNLSSLNTNNPWKSIKELYCNNNQLESLSINQPNLEIIDCNKNQLTNLIINAENGGLKEVYCSNNNLANIDITGKNEIEILTADDNSVTQIKMGYSVNELHINNNSSIELDITGVPFINDLYIENNELLEKVCIGYYPIHYEIHDNGSNAYTTQICNVPSGDHFYAGQGIHTFNFQWGLEGELNNIEYDLNEDGENDISFEIEVIDDFSGEIVFTTCFVVPLNNNLISSSSEYYIQGLHYGDTISPSIFDWQSGEKIYYYSEDGYGIGVGWWDWYLEDGYFAVLIPGETDTTYSWVNIGWDNENDHPTLLNGYVCWKKCINSLELGEDIEASIENIITLDAGEGFDTYLWNTGETSQSITVDCSIIGEGIHTYSILAKEEGCYYTDTIIIQVGDDIGYAELQFDQISVGPNPCSEYISVQNINEVNLQLEIIDITGNSILEENVKSKSERINVQQLPAGIYFCRIISAENSSIIKLLKQ